MLSPHCAFLNIVYIVIYGLPLLVLHLAQLCGLWSPCCFWCNYLAVWVHTYYCGSVMLLVVSIEPVARWWTTKFELPAHMQNWICMWQKTVNWVGVALVYYCRLFFLFSSTHLVDCFKVGIGLWVETLNWLSTAKLAWYVLTVQCPTIIMHIIQYFIHGTDY